MADACDHLLADATGYRAESFAAEVDVGQAGVELELAIHAAEPNSVAAHLNAASQWLRYAQSMYGAAGDEGLASQAACAAATLTTYAGAVPSDPDALATWQGTVLYPFHGVLRALDDEAVGEGSRDATAIFLSVFGLVLLVLGSDAYIDWRKTHGGYARAAARRY